MASLHGIQVKLGDKVDAGGKLGTVTELHTRGFAASFGSGYNITVSSDGTSPMYPEFGVIIHWHKPITVHRDRAIADLQREICSGLLSAVKKARIAGKI